MLIFLDSEQKARNMNAKNMTFHQNSTLLCSFFEVNV
jgi:hypothetical protein